MKSEILGIENEKKSPYPYLGQYKGLIVLFRKKKCGTVLITPTAKEDGGDWDIGDYHTSWDEPMFCPLPPKQKIALSNY